MSRSGEEFYREFNQAVPELFQFLETQYGFQLLPETEWLWRAWSAYCLVTIYVDHNRVAVELKPLGPNPKAGVEIPVIAECLRPDLNFEFGNPLSIATVRTDLQTHAMLLKECCSDMLKGDFTRWSQLQACLDERRPRIEAEMKQLVERTRKLGEQAEIAWQNRDYDKVAALYEEMGFMRTSEETKRFKFAKEKIRPS